MYPDHMYFPFLPGLPSALWLPPLKNEEEKKATSPICIAHILTGDGQNPSSQLLKENWVFPTHTPARSL